MDKRSLEETGNKVLRSEGDLAGMVVRVAAAGPVDVIICATETGDFALQIHGLSQNVRLLAATTNIVTHENLIKKGLETVVLPIKAFDRHSQVRHMLSVALNAQRISIGDLALCTLGRNVYRKKPGDLIVVCDVESSIEYLAVSDLLKLTDGIRPSVLEIAISAACKIGQISRSGKNIGAIIMLGDSLKVLKGSKQLIPNPFQGHDDADRRLTNSETQNALVELSKLDGAFVLRGDGFIQSAGTFLATFEVEVEIPPGFGARHLAAAATTKRTDATAIVVSATDGYVRVFSGGAMVLQLDPNIFYDFVVGDR